MSFFFLIIIFLFYDWFIVSHDETPYLNVKLFGNMTVVHTAPNTMYWTLQG